MAEEERVDPQYLWILPKYFELTDHANLELEGCKIFFTDDPRHVVFKIKQMIEGNSALRIGYAHYEDDDFEEAWKQYIAFMNQQGLSQDEMEFARYSIRQAELDNLHALGLSVRGGLVAWNHKLQAASSGDSPPAMSDIIVEDPSKARRYFKIGIELPSANLEYPASLKEAATIFGKVSALVGDTMTAKELDSKIQGCVDEKDLWQLKREKFRVTVLDFYRNALVGLALEEKANELRGGKRRRLS